MSKAGWSSFHFSKARSAAILSSPPCILALAPATYLLAGLPDRAGCGWLVVTLVGGHVDDKYWVRGLASWVWVPRPKEGRLLEWLGPNPLYCWLTIHHFAAPQGRLGAYVWSVPSTDVTETIVVREGAAWERGLPRKAESFTCHVLFSWVSVCGQFLSLSSPTPTDEHREMGNLRTLLHSCKPVLSLPWLSSSESVCKMLRHD